MKRFLLALGILLCMQCCTFARNLLDLENGSYVDLDSLRTDGNYGYALFEGPFRYDPRFRISLLEEFDLLNNKVHAIKGYMLDFRGKIISIVEESELSQDDREWGNIPKGSIYWIILETLKKIRTVR